MNAYQPTIWRTCRVLANAHRLQCLQAVLSAPGSTVGEVAERCGFPHSQASAFLRALQARGLIQPARESRWVRYYPQPDPIVPSAGPILAGMGRALMTDKMPGRDVLRCLTAFTHPRRLTVLALLQQNRSLPFTELSGKSRVSPPALRRHLGKLQRRGMVAAGEDDSWTLLPPPTALAAVFMSLLTPANNPPNKG
jgi:DNA-binding transcriptional ArsR family regulator